MVKKLIALKNRFLQQDDGATAIEYGLIAAGIALAISAVVLLLGDQLETVFQGILTAIGG